MDPNKKSSIQSVNQFSQLHFLKKATQVLISISVFSLLFYQPSLLTGLLQYFDHCAPTYSIKLFNYNTERNYIFLLFNGILALIIKNSGLISPPMNSTSLKDNKMEKIDRKPELSSDAELPNRKTEVSRETEVEEHGIQNEIVGGENDEAQENGDGDGDGDGVEEEEETLELLTAEELNRKCDDFIKKMREGIKTEVQQIIMVQNLRPNL